jgi:1,4-dihydroxy-6-naphthoate synthase
LKIHQVLKDIQSLNHDAIKQTYEVSAISFAAYPLVSQNYAVMPCGASMGYKYGPILVAPKQLTRQELQKAKIAIPGKLTTAYLTLQIYQSGLNVFEVPFDQIIDVVKRGEADAGLLIHEGQLTYSSLGLKKIVDLGEWWFDQTQLPLPLGGNVIKKSLGPDLIRQITTLLKDSIVYSLEHRKEALEYAMTFARDMAPDLADKFVGMYVNKLTVDYGDEGRKAVSKLFEKAYDAGVIKEKISVEFV